MAQPEPAKVLPILWFAFLNTHAILAAIPFFYQVDGTDLPLAPLLGLLALGAAGVAVQGGLLRGAASNVQAWFILRFALAEGAAVLGFAAYVLSGDHVVQLGCAALGLVAHLACFPTPAAQAGYGQGR